MQLLLSANALDTATQVADVAEKSAGFEVNGASVITSFDVFGLTFNLTETITVQWVVVLILAFLFFFLGRNLKLVPESRKQVVAELIVNFFRGSVNETMGAKYSKYSCYIGALFFFSVISSLMGLLGMKPPTSDLSMIASWGILTFVFVNTNKFKTGGVKGFGKSFFEPLPFMLPFNIIEVAASPFSQTMRHFGNIMSGWIIMALLNYALGGLSHMLHMGLPFLSVGIPAFFSLYFDLFASVIQAYVFTLLTMAYISMADCAEE